MKKRLICLCVIWLLSSGVSISAEMNFSELKFIVQAGGSLIIDLEKNHLGVSELVTLASNLKYNSTLTIKMAPGKSFTSSQCAQIAKASPGHVVFWF